MKIFELDQQMATPQATGAVPGQTPAGQAPAAPAAATSAAGPAAANATPQVNPVDTAKAEADRKKQVQVQRKQIQDQLRAIDVQKAQLQKQLQSIK
jgi:hypothetical protein|tara:strand:- start:928 stop:1215 length:288 start_codon:yes stop_codon:yes gene_type:complete